MAVNITSILLVMHIKCYSNSRYVHLTHPAHLSRPRHTHEGRQDSGAERTRDFGQQDQLGLLACSLGLIVPYRGEGIYTSLSLSLRTKWERESEQPCNK